MENIEKYSVITEKLEITKENGKVIRGLIFRPGKDGAFPTAIFSHGFGSNYKQLMHHGNEYAENGIVCIFQNRCSQLWVRHIEGSPGSRSRL